MVDINYIAEYANREKIDVLIDNLKRMVDENFLQRFLSYVESEVEIRNLYINVYKYAYNQH